MDELFVGCESQRFELGFDQILDSLHIVVGRLFDLLDA